jgi:hypothetical protein
VGEGHCFGWQVTCPSRLVTSYLRLSTSPGYLQLITGIPVGKTTGMETCGSESLVITSLRGSGCMFWVMQLLAASTRETIIYLFIILLHFGYLQFLFIEIFIYWCHYF